MDTKSAISFSTTGSDGRGKRIAKGSRDGLAVSGRGRGNAGGIGVAINLDSGMILKRGIDHGNNDLSICHTINSTSSSARAGRGGRSCSRLNDRIHVSNSAMDIRCSGNASDSTHNTILNVTGSDCRSAGSTAGAIDDPLNCMCLRSKEGCCCLRNTVRKSAGCRNHLTCSDSRSNCGCVTGLSSNVGFSNSAGGSRGTIAMSAGLSDGTTGGALDVANNTSISSAAGLAGNGVNIMTAAGRASDAANRIGGTNNLSVRLTGGLANVASVDGRPADTAAAKTGLRLNAGNAAVDNNSIGIDGGGVANLGSNASIASTTAMKRVGATVNGTGAGCCSIAGDFGLNSCHAGRGGSNTASSTLTNVTTNCRANAANVTSAITNSCSNIVKTNLRNTTTISMNAIGIGGGANADGTFDNMTGDVINRTGVAASSGTTVVINTNGDIAGSCHSLCARSTLSGVAGTITDGSTGTLGRTLQSTIPGDNTRIVIVNNNGGIRDTCVDRIININGAIANTSDACTRNASARCGFISNFRGRLAGNGRSCVVNSGGGIDKGDVGGGRSGVIFNSGRGLASRGGGIVVNSSSAAGSRAATSSIMTVNRGTGIDTRNNMTVNDKSGMTTTSARGMDNCSPAAGARSTSGASRT